MGLAEKLHGKLVALDTSIFIYYIEEHPDYSPLLDNIFEKILEGDIKIVTSTVPLLELLVKPIEQSKNDLIEEYKKIFDESDHIDLIGLSPEIAEDSAKIRAKYRLKTPDAIQIGTAVNSDADSFLTNDKRLSAV